MKQETQDALAVEVLALAAVALVAFVACWLLAPFALLPYRLTFAALYGLRWVWWAVQHARTRPALRPIVGRWLQVIGVILGLFGLALVPAPLRGASPLLWLPAGIGIAGGWWIHRWADAAFVRGPRSTSSASDAVPPTA